MVGTGTDGAVEGEGGKLVLPHSSSPSHSVLVEELWEWLPEELLLRVLEILRRDSRALCGVLDAEGLPRR